jgi:hypothetical protein
MEGANCASQLANATVEKFKRAIIETAKRA